MCALRFFLPVFSRHYSAYFQALPYSQKERIYGLASLELAKAALLARDEHDVPIVGFDLAGQERGFPAKDHLEAYTLMHQNFVGKTVHAGEDYGPESIFQAITDCHADRIGHGTWLFSARRIQDPSIRDRRAYVDELVRYVADRRITLEVCLTSNQQTIPEFRENLGQAPVRAHAQGTAQRHPVHGQPVGVPYDDDRRGGKGGVDLPPDAQGVEGHPDLRIQAVVLSWLVFREAIQSEAPCLTSWSGSSPSTDTCRRTETRYPLLQLMRHRIGAYLHPWDLGWLADRGGLTMLREMGLADVAFPAAYHAGTWTTPVGTNGLVRRLEDGIVYFRPGDDYGELRPASPCAAMPATGRTALEECIARADDAGLESHAWTVLFHNTRLGLHASRIVRAQRGGGRVRVFALSGAARGAGVRVATRHGCGGSRGAERRSRSRRWGFMGYRHGGHHVKRSFVIDPYLDFLLSFCFCDHCKQGLTGLTGRRGGDCRQVTAGLLHRILNDGDAMAPQDLGWQESFDRLAAGLGRKVFLAMIRHRTMVYVGFLTKLRSRMREGVRLSVHLNMDPLFSGSQIGQPFHSVASMVDEIVVTHYGESPLKMAEKWRGQKSIGKRTRVAVWPKAPEYTSDKDLVAVMNLVEEHHLDGARLYHLGLLPWRTVERALRVFTQ